MTAITRKAYNKCSGSSGPILIVDDESDIRDMLAMAISSHGHEVKVAAHFFTALRIMTNDSTIRCMLLDYNMPGMPTRSFMKQVRALYPNLPVILMTAADCVEAKARELGLGRILGKPFEIEDCLALINGAMQSPA